VGLAVFATRINLGIVPTKCKVESGSILGEGALYRKTLSQSG